MSEDQAKVNEDYRRVALYRNAKAAMESVDAAHAAIAQIVSEREKDRQQVLMLQRELSVLTRRFNEQFIKLAGNGATDGPLN